MRLFALAIAAALLAGCQTLMPTPQQPYTVDAPAARPVPWTWTDARPPHAYETHSTQAGVLFGDSVIRPRPFEAVQSLFAQAVDAHEDAAALRTHLAGRTLTLLAFEPSVGLWMRTSDRQQGNWEFVRVRMVVDVGSRRYEALDVRKFSNADQPSPLDGALRGAVANLVNQIRLFP